MTIYRGPGGGGNATTDSELTLLTQLEQSATAKAAEAADSAAAALVSANNAEISEDNAASSATAADASAIASANSAVAADTSADNAAASAVLAQDWATKTTGTVDGVEYSAKYYAQQAETFDPANFVNLSTDQTVGGTKTFSNAIVGSTTTQVSLTGNQTIAGTKTFSNTISGSIDGNAATVTNGVYTTGNQTIAGTKTFSSPIAGSTTTQVSLTGNETIAGTKTFSSAPVVPGLNGGQLAGMRNKIINGKMEIAQRGTSFAASGTAYTLDRWRSTVTTTAARCDITQSTDVPSSNEFQYSLRATVSTADAAITTNDRYSLAQRVEGYNVRDLIGRTFTLSFWIRSSKTGTHCVALVNSGLDRSYVAEYTVSAANTWEKKSITVTGGLITEGTWDWTNGVGIDLLWQLAAGPDRQTTADAWQTGSFVATANQVNCLDTIGNIFAITGVQLEVGSVATPFEHRPYGAELALCQRYYWRITAQDTGARFGNGFCTSTTSAQGVIQLPVPLRAAITAIEQSGTAADYQVINSGGGPINCSSVPIFASGNSFFTVVVVFTVASGLSAGNATAFRAANSNAYLGFSAEL